MASIGSHYLELEQVPLVFDPLERTKGSFFDQGNFQMFCVQEGFSKVKVNNGEKRDEGSLNQTG